MTGNTPGGAAAHAVALYESDDDLRSKVLPFLQEALAAGAGVIAVVSDRAAAVLRESLGPDSRNVQWQVPGITYRSLGLMIDGLRRHLAGHRAAGNDSVRLLAENDTVHRPGRTAAYLRFEAASNEVLGAFDYPWACLYDRRRYPPETLDHVLAVHPQLLDDTGRFTANAGYVETDTYLAAHPGPLSQVPPQVAVDTPLVAAGQLAELRITTAQVARRLGLAPSDCDDFELATAEILSNAIRHGVPPCRVRLWSTPHHIVVRVDDRGPGDGLATAGFRVPDPARGHLGGMGLWIARQLADAVHVGTGPDGTAVELQFPRAPFLA